MTGQAPDWVFYKERRYQMLTAPIDQTGRMLTELGVRCLMLGTDCHRGYIADYEIDAHQLFIKRLEVGEITAPEHEVEAEIAWFMDRLVPIAGVYPTAELIRHVLFPSKPGGEEEPMVEYSIVYHLKYFYQISTQFTLLYREDQAFVGTFLMKPFPDEVVKISVKKGHVQEAKIITEELRVIQHRIDAIYEEGRKSPNREMVTDLNREQNALYKQKDALLEEF